MQSSNLSFHKNFIYDPEMYPNTRDPLMDGRDVWVYTIYYAENRPPCFMFRPAGSEEISIQ
jgi:hypothetical protein